MKKGFTLISAIIFLTLIASLSALTLALSSMSIKFTSDNFLKAEANLLLRSGTEYALLAMSGHEYNTTCVEKIDISHDNFDINISIQYLGSGLPCSTSHIISNTLDTMESNRTAIIDTYVSTKTGIATEPIRLHRRTIQKP